MPVISKITGAPFRFWCQKILPAVYDDSLSYYELLCKVVDYLNKVMEDDINVVNLVNELEEFVNNYFDNLDVQEEINNKLDAMVESGEFSAVLSDFIEEHIDLVNETLKEFSDEYFENLDVQDYVDTKVDEMTTDGSFGRLLADYIVPVYPENYGAVGDGVTDDTEAFLDLFSESKYVILSNNKTYLITDILPLKSGTTIDLNNSTIKCTNQYLFRNFTSTDGFQGYAGNGDITIRNGKIEGGCAQLAHASNIVIENVYWYHTTHDHYVELCSCENVHIMNNKFSGMLYFNNSSLEYINIDPCVYDSFPYFGDGSVSYDETPCKDIYISNNYITKESAPYNNMLDGIGCHALVNDVPLHSNINIVGNTIKGSTNSGISMLMMTESRACDNYLYSEQSGFRVGKGNRNVIVGNHYTSNNSLIAMVNFWAPVTNISIYDNLIENFRTDIISGQKVITGTTHINGSTFIKLQLHYMGYGSGTTYTSDLNTNLFNVMEFDVGNISGGSWVHHRIKPYVNRGFQANEKYPYYYIDTTNVTRGEITFAQNSMTSTHQLNYVWFGADFTHDH